MFAEQYNPEEADEEKEEVYPKTDEQRQRLKEAVQDTLLFRSLDNVNIVFFLSYFLIFILKLWRETIFLELGNLE